MIITGIFGLETYFATLWSFKTIFQPHQVQINAPKLLFKTHNQKIGWL